MKKGEPKLYLPKYFISGVGHKFRGTEPSAWQGLPSIIPCIMEDFGVKGGSAIEFGCEFGYSTAALAHCFERVVAVDTFEGDEHSGVKSNHIGRTAWNLANYPNVELKIADYREFTTDENYDFAHVDIVHTYDDTFACGQLALDLAPVVIFHDTTSFADVFRAVSDLAEANNCDFHNYHHHNGLGIIKRFKG